MVSYKSRLNAKDFIQVEVVVEKNSQKIILIGKVKACFVFFVRTSIYSVKDRVNNDESVVLLRKEKH